MIGPTQRPRLFSEFADQPPPSLWTRGCSARGRGRSCLLLSNFGGKKYSDLRESSRAVVARLCSDWDPKGRYEGLRLETDAERK